ncbi:MAG: PTS transporter subunit EIIC [Lachnospiraceae bacterium]|jgi:PTS system beta-glucosides-specific IIC component|nr:PTS transporter subunit EIIC [Lachnospiraceae bacterium]
MTSYTEFAKKVIELVGGPDNIHKASHCVSRLRFDLKDMSVVKEEDVKQMEGVLGTQKVNRQFQVVVGHAVGQVFTEVEKLLPDISDHDLVKEDAEKPRGNRSPGDFFMGLISHMAGCIYPALAIFVVAGLIKTIPTIFGPGMLGLMSSDSDLYRIFFFISDACFYFLPVFLGYSSAVHFNSNPFIGMILGAVLLAPGFQTLIVNGESLRYFGVPVGMYDYSMTVLPVILMTAAESYLERFLKKHIPDKLQMMLVPTISVLVTSFIGLCFLAPLGQYLGVYLSSLLFWIHDTLGALGTGIMAALYCPLIMTGMHHTVNMVAITALMQNGYDTFLLVAFGPSLMATLGTALAVGLKTRKPEVRSIAFSSAFFNGVCGLSEPVIYGVLLQFPKAMAAYMLGGFAGGLLMGITNVIGYVLLGSNLLGLLAYSGGASMNFVFGIAGSVLAFIVSFAFIWILGYEKKKTVS